MKILSAELIRKADQYTIKNEPIQSIDLMERASRAFVDWFEAYFDKEKKAFIFCGTGNNGATYAGQISGAARQINRAAIISGEIYDGAAHFSRH